MQKIQKMDCLSKVGGIAMTTLHITADKEAAPAEARNGTRE